MGAATSRYPKKVPRGLKARAHKYLFFLFAVAAPLP